MPLILSLPFAANAGIALVGSFARPRHLAVVVLLSIAAVIVPLGQHRSASAAVGAQQREQSKVRRSHAPQIGPYRLDMKVTDAPQITELTPSEKAALTLSLEFKNERIYRAPSADYAGISWDVILGAVDNQLYKISALFSSESRQQRDGRWRSVGGQLRTRLGAPAEELAGVLVWDAEDGNVVLNRAEGGGAYALVLTLTSRAVSRFVRVR
jgi:hypothetical protein